MADFKECGDLLPPGVATLESGGTVPFFLSGSDPDIGGTANQVVDMTTEASDYVSAGVGIDGSFMIAIESAAPIETQLLNGDNFTITTVQATAYLGQWYPAKIIKIYKAGTTGTFSPGR